MEGNREINKGEKNKKKEPRKAEATYNPDPKLFFDQPLIQLGPFLLPFSFSLKKVIKIIINSHHQYQEDGEFP